MNDYSFYRFQVVFLSFHFRGVPRPQELPELLRVFIWEGDTKTVPGKHGMGPEAETMQL